VARAVWRGFRGRCPACGKGRILRGYLSPEPACAHCGEDLTPYRTADFAPYLVTFAIGPIFIPLALLLALHPGASGWALWVLVPAALTLAAILLPRAKGAAIGLLWALDVRG
jgi:uncharacterized protein (DUF983 family)